MRVNEDRLPHLAEAAGKDFPPSEEKKPDTSFEPLALIVPQSVTASDWQGKKQWRLEKLSLAQPDPAETVYALDLSAAYQKEPILLDGKAGLTPAVTNQR